MLHLHRSAVSLFAQKLIIPVSTTSCRSDLSKDAGSDHRQNVDEQWLELCAECGLSGFFETSARLLMNRWSRVAFAASSGSFCAMASKIDVILDNLLHAAREAARCAVSKKDAKREQ